MTEPLLKPIYQHWPSCRLTVWDLEQDHVPHTGDLENLGESNPLRLCREASNRILCALKLQDGDLPLSFIADHCWEKWTRFVRKPSAELHLPFIFLAHNEAGDDQVFVTAKLIFQEIRDQACSGALYPAREMRGVQTDAEWDGAIEAALYHAEQNGFPIPKTSDLRWRVVLDKAPAANENLLSNAKCITGRSAGVTFLLALYHHFGKVAEWNTRQAFESIIALAALPTRYQAEKGLIHLGGNESKKAQALQNLGHASGKQNLHVVLAGSFSGFQNVELPPLVKITHAETVAQLKSAIQEIIRRERMSALEKPQALDFDDYLQLKRKGFVGREWLFEEIDLWSSTSEEPALLITGDPGSGKTSLVAEMIYRNSGGRVIGYHCCQSNEIETLRPARFVQSLAAMIASRLPTYAKLIGEETIESALGDERCEKDPGGTFLECIVQPLNMLPPPDDGVRYILVDAIDEALGFLGQRTIPDVLDSYIRRFPSWLRLVATTRKEPRVMQCLSGLRAKHMDASDERNLQDLTTYLYQRLSEPSLAERLVASFTTADTAVQLISRKSSGNFLYAVQVLDGIARDDYFFTNLDALPRGLDGIYLDFFRRIFGHENTEAGEAAYHRAKPLLQILCTTLEPPTRAELAAASQLDPEEELPQILRKLAQLLSRQIRATGEATITFHHKSVPDWLTTNLDANVFAVGPTKGRNRLAEFCRDTLASSRAKPGWYVRRNAVRHFLEVMDWDSATAALSDIEFIEARAKFQELRAMLSDYEQAVIALPEGEKERAIDSSRQEKLDRYAKDLYQYSEASTKIRNGCRETEPRLPKPIQSVKICSSDEAAAERRRIIEMPNRLDEIKAFRTFVASNVAPLHMYANQLGFAANLARNDAPAGPVHEEGSKRLAPLDCLKLLKQFSSKEKYNPLQACQAIVEGHGEVFCVLLSLDGRRIVSGNRDGTIRIRDSKTAECLKMIKRGGFNSVSSVALNANGMLIVSGSRDGTIQIWNSATDKRHDCFPVHQDAICSVAVSSDGSRIVSGSVDGTIRIWDWDGENANCIKHLQVPRKEIVSLVISADGSHIVCQTFEGNIEIWDSDTGNLLNDLKVCERLVAISADGSRIVSLCGFETIRIRDSFTGDHLRDLEICGDWVGPLAISADGSRIVFGSNDRAIQIWDVAAGVCVQILHGHRFRVSSMAMSADGRVIVSTGLGATIRIWDIVTGGCLKDREDRNMVRSVVISSNGRRIVSKGGIWDGVTGHCLKVLQGDPKLTDSMAISGDGRRIVFDNIIGRVVLDGDSGERLKVLKRQRHKVTALILNHDGRRIVTASADQSIRIWNGDTGDCLKILRVNKHAVTSLSLSKEGDRLISLSADGAIRLWDTNSEKPLKVIAFRGHENDVYFLPQLADNNIVASASRDRTIRIWDLVTENCIKILPGQKGTIDSVVISVDARRTFSVSEDGTIRVWDSDSGANPVVFFLRGLYQAEFNWNTRKLIAVVQGQLEIFILENLPLNKC
jgi:WD40 repeat protein